MTLYNGHGNHDKVYTVWLKKHGNHDQYAVDFAYGRRGARATSESKTPNSYVSWEVARDIFEKLVRDKVNKSGYDEIESLFFEQPTFDLNEVAENLFISHRIPAGQSAAPVTVKTKKSQPKNSGFFGNEVRRLEI